MTVAAIAGLSLTILTLSTASTAINLDDSNDALWSYLVDDSLTPEHLEFLLRHARDQDEDEGDASEVGRPAFKEVKEILTTAAAAEMDLGMVARWL